MSERRASRIVGGLLAVALSGLGPSCGSHESSGSETSAIAIGHARDEPRIEAAQATSEPEAPPAPDARTLAAGRALAAPGPNGFLGTWAVRPDAPCEGDACPPPSVVAFDSPRMVLGDVAAHDATTVTLGATLLVPRTTTATLLVGVRGEAEVVLDGASLGRANSQERLIQDILVAPLTLTEGEHELALRFTKPETGRWRATVRWLSADFTAGPGNVAIALGELPPERAAELGAQAVHLEEIHELDGSTPQGGVPIVRVRASMPAGGVAGPVEITIGDRTETLDPASGIFAGAVEVVTPMPARGVVRIDARVGERTERFGTHIASDRGALNAAVSLAASLERASERSRAPIAWRQQELLRAVREHDADQAWRTLLAGDARRIERLLERGRDPYGDVRGYERMAFTSALDGTAQEYELFVPPGYRENRSWPLLVTLHGYKGNAGDFFRNTFGLARDWENDETLEAHGRHGVAPTSGPMIVIAPTGRGQSYYRHAGETDIVEAMADVERRYAIDRRRVYITGGSMGGTGAAYIPYRHPDVFAASIALAGYHDQRVRVDTDHAALSEPERFLEAFRSDVDWAENGLHLPMLLVRGTRDRPLEWTRTLVRRLDALGYRYEHREPDLGHNVWTDTYAEGAGFTWLRRYQRPESPDHVRLRTARERTRSAYWVTIEQRAAADRFAEVDARLDGTTIDATITGARAVTFAPPVASDAELTIRIGQDELRGHAPLTVEEAGGRWRLATHPWPEPGARRAGASGPIRDVFHDPLTFVVGTQDPRHTLINRLVARTWAHPKGWIVDYPIVDDTEVTDAMMAERSLVLIGPPSSNSVLARLNDRLPIQIDARGVHLGVAVHEGAQVGVAFVAPNPEHPERSVLVLAGPSPLGTLRSNDLPDILPDYVVFDEAVAPAHGRWACGGTGCAYRAHGFFDMHMRLPSN
ncbi:MAG: prolyl oligopeptidase family serine peptidase [Sandaracinaceae bacterium]